MKKLLTILLLFIGFYSFGQDVVGSRVIAKQALYVNGVWVDSIRVDTIGISGDNRTLMTSGAIYKFVSNRAGGGGGGGTPGSPTNSIQYNNAGSFSGSANLLYDASLLTALSAGLGVTQTDTKGIVLTNTTAAALGAQQISPALRLTGQGWQTFSSGSRTVDFRQYALPVQGNSNPSVTWKLQSQINGGGYSDNFQVSSFNEFSLGTGIASAGGHSIAFYGSTSSGVGAVTFSQNATNAGQNTFVAAGQNMIVDAGTVGAASFGTDGHIYATADYSFVANDANLVKGESGSAFGFGTEVHATNSFGAGNTNVLGALTTGSGTGNQYTDEFGMGTQLRITGNRNITFGTRVQNTGTEAVAIGMGFGSTYLVNSRSGVIALGTGSDSATVYIENAGGSTGAFGRFWARGKGLFGDELTVNSLTDQGDFKLQVTGGLYADITGKTWSVQGTVYNSGASLVALAVDTLTGLIYRKTAAGGGSGTVNTGAANKPAYYPSAGTTVDDFAAVNYATSGTNVLITTQNTTDIGLNIKGVSSQSGNLLNVSSSAGTADLASINSTGYLQSVRGGFGGAPTSFTLYVEKNTNTSDLASIKSTGSLAALILDGNGESRLSFNDNGSNKWLVRNLNQNANIADDWSVSNNGGTAVIFIDGASTNFVGISTVSPVSKFEVAGSFGLKYTSTATGITLDQTHCVVEVTATGQTITLPTAVGITGRVYTIKLTASGSCTVATTSSQNIDAATTYSLASQYKYVTVQSNGSNYIVIANN